MDKLDYKKAEKELYLPSAKPSIIDVPEMSFIMVDGKGDPNDPDGEYLTAIGILYALSFTIKMSKMGSDMPAGYFEYVVPPLEGLWWFDKRPEPGIINKDEFLWTSMIRQPDFVTAEVFEAAREQMARKKPEIDTAKARLEKFEEGLCVQCMHVGSYDDEPVTIQAMHEYAETNGYVIDLATGRKHHELYISDPRKVAVEKRRTVLRLPIRKA